MPDQLGWERRVKQRRRLDHPINRAVREMLDPLGIEHTGREHDHPGLPALQPVVQDIKQLEVERVTEIFDHDTDPEVP